MTTHEYKEATIVKRSGMNRNRRALSGYRVMIAGGIRRNFETLRDAKAWVDVYHAAQKLNCGLNKNEDASA